MLVVICLVRFFVKESYAMLSKYQISTAKEEIERVDTLRFQYEKLQSKAVSVSSGMSNSVLQYLVLQ